VARFANSLTALPEHPGPKDLSVSHVIVLPGGSSPRPPFSRFALRAVTGKAPSLPCKSHQLDALRSLEDRRGKTT
jgi:hypothetical protein